MKLQLPIFIDTSKLIPKWDIFLLILGGRMEGIVASLAARKPIVYDYVTVNFADCSKDMDVQLVTVIGFPR